MKIKNKKPITLKELQRKININKRFENENYYNNTKFNLVLKPSQILNSGLGVYTLDFIPENTIIGCYEGELIKSNKPITGHYFYEIQELNLEENKLCIGINAEKYPRCYMAMINDANYNSNFKNNCYFDSNEFDENNFEELCPKRQKSTAISSKGGNLEDLAQSAKSTAISSKGEILENLKINVISDRDIEEGEELFIDYGIGYWNHFSEIQKN